jgi:hypothetical protein
VNRIGRDGDAKSFSILYIVILNPKKTMIMKTTPIKCSTLLLLATTLFFSCNTGSDDDASNDSGARAERTAAGAPPKDSAIYFGLENRENKIVQDGGIEILRGEADTYIGTYRTENNGVWHPLRSTETGERLKGFTISKKVFETLLSQSTETDGIRVYIGKDPRAEQRHYTMVLVATVPDGEVKQGKDLQGKFFQHVDPCPRHCASNDDYEKKFREAGGKQK